MFTQTSLLYGVNGPEWVKFCIWHTVWIFIDFGYIYKPEYIYPLINRCIPWYLLLWQHAVTAHTNDYYMTSWINYLPNRKLKLVYRDCRFEKNSCKRKKAEAPGKVQNKASVKTYLKCSSAWQTSCCQCYGEFLWALSNRKPMLLKVMWKFCFVLCILVNAMISKAMTVLSILEPMCIWNLPVIIQRTGKPMNCPILLQYTQSPCILKAI